MDKPTECVFCGGQNLMTAGSDYSEDAVSSLWAVLCPDCGWKMEFLRDLTDKESIAVSNRYYSLDQLTSELGRE